MFSIGLAFVYCSGVSLGHLGYFILLCLGYITSWPEMTSLLWQQQQQQQQQQPFHGPLSRTTQVSRYQKSKINLDFTDARDSEWQWHQLSHMQICTSPQTDNHASIPPVSFYWPILCEVGHKNLNSGYLLWLQNLRSVGQSVDQADSESCTCL